MSVSLGPFMTCFVTILILTGYVHFIIDVYKRQKFNFVYCVRDCSRESVAAGTGENAEVSDSLRERREK